MTAFSLVMALSILALPALTTTQPRRTHRIGSQPIRGAIISCPRWGPIWGSPAMEDALSELTSLGVNWVAIHPYAWVKRNGTVEYRPARSTEFLESAVKLARRAGTSMFWKPHLGYWGQFEWRGSISFDTEEAWKRFFDQYRGFITDQAAFAEQHGIPLLAVGVEYEKTTHRESDWREMIAAVRKVYSGRLVYAANWDSLDRVPFWDAVDVIGVHAYFPLSAAADPDLDELRTGWDEPLGRLRDLSKRHGDKPVLFAEIGYNVNSTAASEPWRYQVEDTPTARALRVRLMEAAMERVADESVVEGMFWWKWTPGPTYSRRNFSLRDREAQAAIGKHWGARSATTAQ
ncbi:MAG: hypothetical protein OES47_02475 [Acidobacteriota bacterium]|nr:hypothetical protein [Acidobacteriota bacterium]